MATEGDGRALYESGGAEEKLRKRPIRTETSSGISAQGGHSAASWKSKLGQMLKQVTVTMAAFSINTILHCYSSSRLKAQRLITMEKLPDELLTNIFIRLQAGQLAQMRTVSKSWNALLSHPSFIKSHLHRSIRNNNHHSLLVFPGNREPLKQYSCQTPHLEPINFIELPLANLELWVIGSVNGLICLSSEDPYSNVHIWNPSLSALSTIPSPRPVTPNFSYVFYIRFGFDPKTDDYKVVKVSGICDFEVVKEWLQVELYSMRKGSWKFITQPFPSHVKRIDITDNVCVDGYDGYLHWQSDSVVKTERTILAFNLNLETFFEIPLPNSLLDSNHGLYLGVLARKLCVMTSHRGSAWEVWVMEEYGVPESWTKRHVFSQFNDEVRFYGFTLCNEMLLKDEDGRLVLYDPIANKTKSTRTKQRAHTIVEYVDSLVWV